MKNIKKAIVLLLSLLFVLGLSGCKSYVTAPVHYKKHTIIIETDTGESVSYRNYKKLNAAMTESSEEGVPPMFLSFSADKYGILAEPNPAYFKEGSTLTITSGAIILQCSGDLSQDYHVATFRMTPVPDSLSLLTMVQFPYWVIIVPVAGFLSWYIGNNIKKEKALEEEENKKKK